MAAYDGKSGSFAISPTDKIRSDFRSKGRSQYVKGYYLRHAGSGINWRLAMCQSPSMVARKLGFERKLYCRAMIARFSQELGGNWNLGEENTQSSEEQIDMIRFLNETDPYKHNIVIHTFPNQQDKVYTAWLGSKSILTGASLQNGWSAAHQQKNGSVNRPPLVDLRLCATMSRIQRLTVFQLTRCTKEWTASLSKTV